MKVEPEQRFKKARKNKYIPNLAALNFKPTEDWDITQAMSKYYASEPCLTVDKIQYRDCISGMHALPGDSIDCIIADPPFGLSFTGKESIYNRDDRYVRSGYQEARGDYAEFSKKWIAVLPRIMKPTSTAWIFSGWTNLIDILNAARDAKLLLINHIIWRYQFGVFTQRKFVTSHYHVLFFSKTENYYFNKINHYPLDVWDINRTYRKGEVKNGTKLPEELIQRCIDFSTRPGDVVLDPFMGNGTTAVVAKANFRHYVGFELNKSMREVIGANVSSIQVGQGYIPYSEREDEMVERARRKYYSRNRSDV